MDAYSKRIFDHSSRLAEVSNISISMPRISNRQQHRSNPEYDSVADYFKKTITIPFLDHLVSDISTRFTDHSKKAASIVPKNITANSSFTKIEETVEFYIDDLPDPAIMDEEFCRWKSKWLAISKENRPDTKAKSLKQCPKTGLPNIFTLLQLFATLPLSSCSCERSGSALKRLNTYLRCTQTEERLSALALIHINYPDLNVDDVCKCFIKKHPRRMESASLLFDF